MANNKKQCPKCKVFQPLDRYTDGRIQCNICLESKRKYRENHREQLRQKACEYYEANKEKKKAYVKEYRQQMVECSVCKVMIQKCRMTIHEQTKTHLHNLNHPDSPKLTYKQQHEQKLKQQEEEKQERRMTHYLKHQETIAYLNENFPSYLNEDLLDKIMEQSEQ